MINSSKNRAIVRSIPIQSQTHQVNSQANHQTDSHTHHDYDTHDLALMVAAAADDRKGADITLVKVTDVSYLTDYFVIVTGFSKVQVRAIARSIEEQVETTWQRQPKRIEGLDNGSWVLIDYGDVIVHIFMEREREFYDLEAFWGHAEQTRYIPAPPPNVN
jgi:ribosome-associated protein